MDQLWKQFAGSDTASEHRVFLKARLKLTALYVLIVTVIVSGFSIFIFQNIGRNLKDAADEDFAGIESHQHFVQNTLGTVKNDLILADIFIVLVAAGLSFALAGKTLKPIQRSVEAQKAFAANASHELRTPLAVMRNDIEVFLRNPSQDREETKKTMASNLEEIGRMSSIVEDLLTLARSDNHVVSEHGDVDLAQVLGDVVERVGSLARSKGIALSLKAPDQSKMHGTRSSLERAVLNIVHNSISHTSQGGSVEALIEEKGPHVELRITDTGSGIASKDLPHVFKRFYKGDSAKGSGLGLSIVKEIVDEHGGSIAIESALGKGTSISIIFPKA